MTHNVSVFDLWVVINNLSYLYRIVNIVKNGKGIISLTVFNEKVEISEKSKILSVSHLDMEQLILIAVEKRWVLLIYYKENS